MQCGCEKTIKIITGILKDDNSDQKLLGSIESSKASKTKSSQPDYWDSDDLDLKTKIDVGLLVGDPVPCKHHLFQDSWEFLTCSLQRRQLGIKYTFICIRPHTSNFPSITKLSKLYLPMDLTDSWKTLMQTLSHVTEKCGLPQLE